MYVVYPCPVFCTQVLASELMQVNFQIVPMQVEDIVSDIYHSFGSSLLCELAFQNLRVREQRGEEIFIQCP